MGRRKVGFAVGAIVIALAMLGAQSAGAVTGTTAFTCKKKAVEGGAGFSDAHCVNGVGSGAKYEHVEIPANTKTELLVTNASTTKETTAAQPVFLKTTLAGVEVELEAKEARNVGSFENLVAANGEHYIHGTGTTTYGEIVANKPAGKGCKVNEGVLTTKLLTGTSAGKGMAGTLTPAEGLTFGEIKTEGCSIAAINNTYPVTGAVTCSGEGSTALCSHASVTASSTLKFGGQKAGVDVSTTFTGRAPGESEYTPLGVTTVTT
ncbi:MAG TPA: hypothetical protein VFJ57_05635 [Solirubrobacterales bacterium]|nr:hypothetical protein [Solirubrobacterales bacterium]